MATPDYPVTPGDVYWLAYIYSSAVSSISVTVDSGYRVTLSLFGTIDARGLTLAELQKRAAEVVLKTFPGSGPQLFVESVGIFQVYVRGEVTAAGWVSSWGLSRLSSIVGGRLTPYSSTRDVEVVSASGAKTRFDLFLAARSGRKELDPYVRPQDTIVVQRRSREATVAGEVERPGTYQLLEGEDLEDLVRSYGGGFTKLADAAHLQITRWGQGGAAETLYVNDASQPAHVELRDLDVVRVPSVEQRLQVVYFEGAIATAEGQSTTGKGDTFGRIRYAFADGEMLSSALTVLFGRLSAASDLENAYVVRSDTSERIPVDIRSLVQGYDATKDLPLRPFDRIVIPYRTYVVTVSGAVTRPGQYPYVPNRSWRYYVELAGGFDPARHVGETLTITDASDRIQHESRTIEADDKILVPTNNPFYFTPPVIQIVGALAAVVSAVVAVLQFLR